MDETTELRNKVMMHERRIKKLENDLEKLIKEWNEFIKRLEREGRKIKY